MGCEATLGTLRTNGSGLLELLEAILADPLVDWAPEGEDAAIRKVRPL